MPLNPAAEDIIRRWRSGQAAFEVKSSGTTGTPAVFSLSREGILLSCRHTGRFIDVREDDRILCCLPLDRVGGLMQLFRSEIWGIPVEVIPPSADPLLTPHQRASIVSVTPMQLGRSLQQEQTRQELLQFRVVLVGGADVPTDLESEIAGLEGGPLILHTYGMTETYSHIAMRITGREDAFRCIMPTELAQDDRGCLKLRNELTGSAWLQTNDVAEIQPDGSFRILGRADDVINTGGAKVHPAEVEALLMKHSTLQAGQFFIGGISDAETGEKVVLVLLNGTPVPNLETIPFPASYMKPRDIIYVPAFIYTDTQKLKRKETLSQR